MIATLLTRLLQKDVKFEWSDKCQKSFEQLKALLTEAPVLVQPDSDLPWISTDDENRLLTIFVFPRSKSVFFRS
ncbi:RNA-directed DNA polymerase-like protein [Gossypium australe]|uniref:RNA-directed DNA polymerase-like protein n=1 Tax=Gossypium australe TaxID=47621 RepID=A0A5B6WNB1_9ROSI|nr:RNA-directed DNA polymerase-like protein [Gossypium australe]